MSAAVVEETVGGGSDTSSAFVDFPSWAPPAEAVGLWLQLREDLARLEPDGAPCSSDPEAWWAEGASRAGQAAQERAVAGCGVCLVEATCRAYALAARERHGVWGGMTAAERRQLGKGSAR